MIKLYLSNGLFKLKHKKLFIITGGSKGLGYALVNLYTEKGWKVKEISRTGKSVNTINCDLSDYNQSIICLNDLFKDLSNTIWEKVVLINNIGTLNPIGKIHNKSEMEWISNISIIFSVHR